jgi:hypothetical protein
MTYREEILQQALSLPPADRAFVAAALEDSLVPPDAVEAGSPDAVSGSELLAELERRSAAYQTGSMTARPAADVIADLRRPPAGGRGQ